MSGKINFGKLLRKLETERDRIKFLQDNSVMKKEFKCSKCNILIGELTKNKNYFYFFCKDCNKKFSVRTNSILSNANISLRKFTLLVYVFAKNFWSYKNIQVTILLFYFFPIFIVHRRKQIWHQMTMNLLVIIQF